MDEGSGKLKSVQQDHSYSLHSPRRLNCVQLILQIWDHARSVSLTPIGGIHSTRFINVQIVQKLLMYFSHFSCRDPPTSKKGFLLNIQSSNLEVGYFSSKKGEKTGLRFDPPANASKYCQSNQHCGSQVDGHVLPPVIRCRGKKPLQKGTSCIVRYIYSCSFTL